jgi:hypothetical protein
MAIMNFLGDLPVLAKNAGEIAAGEKDGPGTPIGTTTRQGRFFAGMY